MNPFQNPFIKGFNKEVIFIVRQGVYNLCPFCKKVDIVVPNVEENNLMKKNKEVFMILRQEPCTFCKKKKNSDIK